MKKKRYKFEIYGRPKNIDMDEIVDLISSKIEDLQSEGMKISISHSLGIVYFEGPETYSEADINKIKQIIKDTFARRYTDISVEQLFK